MSESPLLIVDLKPSKILLISLACAHSLAAASVFLANLPLSISIVLWLSIILSAGLSLICYGNASSRWFIGQLQYSAKREWVLTTGDGRQRIAYLTAYYLHWQLLVLNFSWADRDSDNKWCWFRQRYQRRAVTMLADSANAEQLRRLRVYLTQLADSELHITR